MASALARRSMRRLLPISLGWCRTLRRHVSKRRAPPRLPQSRLRRRPATEPRHVELAAEPAAPSGICDGKGGRCDADVHPGSRQEAPLGPLRESPARRRDSKASLIEVVEAFFHEVHPTWRCTLDQPKSQAEVL